MQLMPDFRLHRPASVAEAAALLAAPAGGKPLGGGTDLLVNLRRGLGEPASLLDLQGIAELAAVTTDAGGVTIGAAVTLERLAEHPAILDGWPAVAAAAASIAGPGHRAAATVGGNLCQDTRCVYYNQSEWWRAGNGYCLKHRGSVCHVVKKSDRCYAAYAGDFAPVLMVLGAEVEVAGAAGVRRLPVAGLYHEEGRSWLTLAPGEFLTAVRVPAAAPGSAAGYDKIRIRDAIDFPLAGVAITLRRDGEIMADIGVAVTGVASAPLLVPGLEALAGQPWSDAAAKVLVQAVRKTCNTVKTTLTTPRYRRAVAGRAAARLAARLWAGG